MAITKIVYQSVIDKCEGSKKFKNLMALAKAIAKTSFAQKYGLQTPEQILQAALDAGCKAKTENGNFAAALQPKTPKEPKVKVPKEPKVKATKEPKSDDTPRKRGKVKLEISQEELQKAVEEVEANQTITNLGALWVAVCNTDWAKNLQPRPLTPAVASMRGKELGIKIQTEHHGKPKLEISKAELEAVVQEVESKQTFDNLSALWKAIAETEWAKNMQPKAVTPSIAAQRVAEFGIKTQTQPGRKKRQHVQEDVLKIEEDDKEDNHGVISGQSEYGEFLNRAEKPKVDHSKWERGPDLLQNAGIGRCKGRCFIITPAGPCPAKLASTEPEDIERWCRKVLEAGAAKNVQYSRTALMYWVREFFEMYVPEVPNAVNPEYLTVLEYVKSMDPMLLTLNVCEIESEIEVEGEAA